MKQQATKYFTNSEERSIISAIKDAEKQTSGEIRVHIDKLCPQDPMDRAKKVFTRLKMHRTEDRNGVLIYVAMEARKIAIFGDEGINREVPQNFWEETLEKIKSSFHEGNMAEGIIEGIQSVGNQLSAYFPYQRDDQNELSDEISFE